MKVSMDNKEANKEKNTHQYGLFILLCIWHGKVIITELYTRLFTQLSLLSLGTYCFYGFVCVYEKIENESSKRLFMESIYRYKKWCQVDIHNI